ncbi:bacteriocin-associated integral membrane family protein [Bacillus wiedmannii]|uniref:bacteriocin-associated integral membrane family protein n=1 Tax=Bacillus wiedmannii TaxID=1890302 RepID=UPI003D204FA7
MKKVVVFFLIVASILSGFIAFQQTDHKEFEKMEKVEQRIGKEFVIPDVLGFANPSEIYPILLEAAKESHTNIFRTNVAYHEDEHAEILKYVLLTTETIYFKQFQLSGGDVLKPKDTFQGNAFLSTVHTKDTKQKGVIKDFGDNHVITIKPLQTSYEHLPMAGRYVVEGVDDKSYDAFLKLFSKKLNQHFKPKQYIVADDFKRNLSNNEEALDSPINSLSYIQYMVFIVLLCFLIYYVFNEAKRIGVIKMHGVSNLRLWFIVIGRTIASMFVLSIGISVLATAFVKNVTSGFIYTIMFDQCKTYLIITILSLVSYFYISKIKVNQMIKNRKDTKGIFVFNTLLKVTCSIIFVLLGTSILEQYITVKEKQVNLKNWEKNKDYGVFYPLSVGNDEEQQGMHKTASSINGDLYPILNKMGAVLIDSKEYEEIELSRNKDYKGIWSVTVNNNYLREFPLYDIHNQRVKVSEDTENWILLVPEKYQNREKEILRFFEERRKPAIEYEEKRMHREVPNHLRNRKIDIIWIKNNQEIFSFNPDVYKSDNNKIRDEIIEVMTEKNSFVGERDLILGGGANDPLKIKLIKRDAGLTYKTLEPELKRLGLDDNLRYLVTVDQYISKDIYNLQKTMKILLTVTSGLIVGILFLVAQNIIVYFNKNQQKIVVHRLFGVDFFRTYKGYMLQFVLMWIVQLSICFIVKKEFDLKLLTVVAMLILIEFTASIIALITMERRNKKTVIKGG